MKKILLALVLCLALPLQAFALVDENHTLYLTVVNQSNRTLEFQRVLASNPGNYFTMYFHSDKLLPGETGVIAAETVRGDGIWGELAFKDETTNLIKLTIRDPEQRKNVQPIFSMSGGNIKTEVMGKIRHQKNDGRFILYIGALMKVVQ